MLYYFIGEEEVPHFMVSWFFVGNRLHLFRPFNNQVLVLLNYTIKQSFKLLNRQFNRLADEDDAVLLSFEYLYRFIGIGRRNEHLEKQLIDLPCGFFVYFVIGNNHPAKSRNRVACQSIYPGFFNERTAGNTACVGVL